MNTLALSLTDPAEPLTSLRCQALAGMLERVARASGRTPVEWIADPASALDAIASSAGLVGPRTPTAGGEIHYVPTPMARERVGDERDGDWAAAASRHRKSLRRTPGALFTFPAEGATGPAPDDAVRVFTTDWSPTPAACALAVHPSHPLGVGLPADRTAAFTGRFCRHPITADLLPVWTAEWVRPEFGTGAVLVNPGHDATDLAFAREIGLPVRFALATPDPDGAQAPPVIRAGRAVRTGVADGLDPGAAEAEYLRLAGARGLAEEHVDIGAGSFAVATFTDDGECALVWDPERRTVADTGTAAAASTSAVLAAAEAAVREADLSVVVPSTAIESSLLALRLLLAEPALGPLRGTAPEIVTVGRVAATAEEIDDDVLALALLTGADARETLALKAPALDTARRFLHAHSQLVATSGTGAGGDAVPKEAAQVKGLLLGRDTKQAFTSLYRLQKSLTKADAVPESSLAAYEALAWVLAGLPGRRGTEAAREAWERI